MWEVDKNKVIPEEKDGKEEKHARCTRIICLAHFCGSCETCNVYADQIFMAFNTIFNIGFEVEQNWPTERFCFSLYQIKLYYSNVSFLSAF